MKKIRDVLRLTFELGMSRRNVAAATGIGRTAVTDYVQRAGAAGLGWPLPDGLDDAMLAHRLFPPVDASQPLASTEPDWTVIHAEMKRRGVTMTLLWQEYRAGHPQGYAYSWFCERYRDWKKGVSPTMRQSHAAGEKLFVDWAGDTIAVFDATTGVEHRARNDRLQSDPDAEVSLRSRITAAPGARSGRIQDPDPLDPILNRGYRSLRDPSSRAC